MNLNCAVQQMGTGAVLSVTLVTDRMGWYFGVFLWGLETIILYVSSYAFGEMLMDIRK